MWKQLSAGQICHHAKCNARTYEAQCSIDSIKIRPKNMLHNSAQDMLHKYDQQCSLRWTLGAWTYSPLLTIPTRGPIASLSDTLARLTKMTFQGKALTELNSVIMSAKPPMATSKMHADTFQDTTRSARRYNDHTNAIDVDIFMLQPTRQWPQWPCAVASGQEM